MQPITPYLTINGADKALEYDQKAFGATDIFAIRTRMAACFTPA